MKWILILVITMPCICMVYQDAIPQENAERDAAIDEIVRREKMAIAAQVVEKVKFRALLNSPGLSAPDPTKDFFSA